MRCALRESGRVTLLSEPISKTSGCERLAEFGEQECQVGLRESRQHLRQLWVDRDHQRRIGLFLSYRDLVAL